MNTMAKVTAIAVSTFLSVSAAFAAYLDSDYGKSGVERPVMPPQEIIRPIPPRPRVNPVTDLVRRIEVGSPYRHHGLTVFPLMVNRPGSQGDIRTLDEALRREWIDVREKGDAQVGVVHVRNDSGNLVFLMAGEIISGGRQNRVISEDVLLPPRSRYVEVPVYCVEQDRWAGKTEKFSSPESVVHQGLRKRAVAGESQADIWSEASAKADSAGVSSRTRNYQEIYEDKDVKRRLDECASRFSGFCRRDTVGAVAVVGDTIVSCDIFTDPDLFSRLWGKLCRSYALENVSAAERDSYRRPEHVSNVTVRDVERFLSDAIRADYSGRPTQGAGRVLRIGGIVTGQAIIWNEETVHAAVFPGYAPVPVPMRRSIIED